MYILDVEISHFPDRTAVWPPYDFSDKISIGPIQSLNFARTTADRIKSALKGFGSVVISTRGKSSCPDPEMSAGDQAENLLKLLKSKVI